MNKGFRVGDPGQRGRPPRRRWSIGIAVLVSLFAVTLVGATSVRTGLREREMVATDPDSLPDRPTLAAVALSEGRQVFVAHCSGCHGYGGGANHALGVPDLTDHDYLYGEGRTSEIEDIVRHGIRAGDRRGRNFAEMPVYASARPYQLEPIPPLSPSDIRDVVAMLRSRGGKVADVAAAARGGEIYLGRGGCYDCHGGDARGDPAIGAPNLLDGVWLYGDGSPRSIASSIEHGRRGYSPAYAGTLSAADIRAVAYYTANLSHPVAGSHQ